MAFNGILKEVCDDATQSTCDEDQASNRNAKGCSCFWLTHHDRRWGDKGSRTSLCTTTTGIRRYMTLE
ncbi:hypothetical protein BDM02DRAFT_3124985 [Thelephora ganbajun]|uniref:Uncharacterized protein n=1 Tax=Thelephora ganbajun TaxID=370292 RepID=A0ACB6YWZ9_THEGA|nr:hypothetical protein BDM02DRAFT_3124985 [Thelephora ganbajun]